VKFSLKTRIRPIGSETSVTYDAGVYRKLAKTLDVRISGNYIDTSNYWVADTSSVYYAASSYTYTLNSLKFYGFESEFNWTPTEKLVVFGNYSLLGRKYTADPSLPYAELLNLAPKNKGNLSVRYSLPLKTRVAFDLKAFGERKSEGEHNVMGGYTVGDISLEKALPGGLTAGFFISNLFGMDYQQVFGYPAPGRMFGIRLQANLAKNPLPR
jgi:outer membrane receptor protein involved in Fe transport